MQTLVLYNTHCYNIFSMKSMREFSIGDESSGFEDNISNSEPLSRHDVLSQLQMLGVNAEAFKSMSIDALNELLMGVQAIVDARPTPKRGRPKSTGEFIPIFSQSDKKILQRLITSNGRVSSLSLSRQLDIPLSTIQRRRSRLEEHIVDINYSLKLKGLGWRTATLFVAVSNGKADLVGKEILEMTDMVSSVTRIMGEDGMDLKLEVIFKKTEEYLSLVDHIKTLGAVEKIFCGESVNLIGRSSKCYERIIESV